jgi:cobalt/nickel transport system permease protein
MTRRSFIERSIESLHAVADRSLFSETIARSPGFLQSLDARAKLAGFVALIVAVVIVRDLAVVWAMLAAAILLILASRVRALPIFERVWLVAFLFTATAVLPAIVITKGNEVAQLPLGLAISEQGLRSAALLIGRVETATTLSLLLVLTTRWSDLLRALRSARVPLVFVVVIGMTYRYIFVVLQIATELFEGRRSRRIGKLAPAEERKLATSTAGALLTRTMQLSDDIYLAMQSRGFRGEVRVLDRRPMRAADWLALTSFVFAAVAATIIGR